MVSTTSSKTESVIIQEQVKALLRTAYSHKDNIIALKDKLEEYKVLENRIFKPKAIEIALEHMEKHPSKFASKLCEVVRNSLSSKDITMINNKTSLEPENQNNVHPVEKEDYKTISEYRKAYNRTPETLAPFMKRAIEDNDINEIISLNDLNKSLDKKRIIVEGGSPLEYALKLGKDNLSLKMMQAGFVINHRSKIEQSSVNEAIQNIIQRRSGRNMVQDILNGAITDKPLRRSR